MDGRQEALRDRWMQRAEAAFKRMFDGKSQEELVTLTQRETMAIAIAKELAAFLLKEHVALDSATRPTEASSACCPKCGQPGERAAEEGENLSERTVRTRAGDIPVHRERWACVDCRIFFFPAGRSPEAGDRRLQPSRAGTGGTSGEQGSIVRRGERRPEGTGGRGDQPNASATAE